MKAFIYTLIACAVTLVAADTWGGSYSLGPAKTNIIEMTTTLAPGAAPSTQTGMLFLWPGISNGTGDLVQTTLEQWPDNSWCGAGKGEWCVRASVFGWFGQRDGPGAVVKATDSVTMNYKLGSNKMTWTQTVTINNKVVSTLTSESGPYMKGWGTGTECNGGCTGTISAQKYTNTVITLDAADPNFGKTASSAGGATATGLTSEQGGKVWKIATINVPRMG
ncbi:hypothetical protein RSOLAG1IB_08394 [Rhizoctonia solani AG-1 IB]|uniref:Uncharacterized protein n=1 Tax=Thanatephorus cucumeris (strain AG1-IB / isolate 7/3/14) TaxID=1108050 RepID=M5BNW6_THACB|nr:hypothetical protein BN14_02772 [Rhizoctonia solani AG-1 IB]CEL57161.1 hypothetical protein RSOLAG1IB_08394 [Rhizoctonia solani AG-1 IB]